MPGAKQRDISAENVHCLIESCLECFMTKEETMHTLSIRLIPPSFTEQVWEKLEQQNQEFFRAYYRHPLTSLQVDHRQRPYLLNSYGSHVSPTQQISTTSVENTRFPNGSSAQSSMQRNNIDPSFMSQNGSSAPSSMQRNNIDPSFMCQNGALAQSSMQRINIDPSFMSQNGSSAQSSMQRNNIDPSFMSQNESLAQSSTQRINIDPSFMSPNGNMGLAKTINCNIGSTEAGSSAEDLTGKHIYPVVFPVQCRVQDCLRNYMTKEETIHYLRIRFQIPPRSTEQVWERLEEENQEFFRDYNRQLVVNNQIVESNRQRPYMLNSYGSHVSPTQQIYTASVENTRLPNGLSAQSSKQRINIDPSFISENGSSAQSSMQRNNIDPNFMSTNGSLAQSSTQRINIDPSFMSENGNMGLAETMNRNIVTTEADSSAQHLIGRLLNNDTSTVVFQVCCRIKQCLQRYMTKEETMRTLSVQFQIHPHFIEQVWEKLEEENQEFFRAYNRQLVVNNQILKSNRLIAPQEEHRQQLYPLNSHGSHVSPTQQISTASVEKTGLPNRLSAQSSQQGINVDPSFMSQNRNMGLAETMNRNFVTTEADSIEDLLNLPCFDPSNAL